MRALRLAAILAGLIAAFVCPKVSAQSTIYYIVRHGEVDLQDPNLGLNEAGKHRVKVLSESLRDVPFTHVLCSHTTRTLQTVELTAQRRGIEVVQCPKPGSTLNDQIVTDRTPSPAATAPLVDALRRLPSGSVALVGVNSNNAFAILHGLGVPLASPDHPYAPDQTCVPCLDNSCFPQSEYDNLWILILEGPSRKPLLLHHHYGTATIAKPESK